MNTGRIGDLAMETLHKMSWEKILNVSAHTVYASLMIKIIKYELFVFYLATEL